MIIPPYSPDEILNDFHPFDHTGVPHCEIIEDTDDDDQSIPTGILDSKGNQIFARVPSIRQDYIGYYPLYYKE